MEKGHLGMKIKIKILDRFRLNAAQMHSSTVLTYFFILQLNFAPEKFLPRMTENVLLQCQSKIRSKHEGNILIWNDSIFLEMRFT